jgi:membrane protease subunit HflC
LNHSWWNISLFAIVATIGVLIRFGSFIVYEGSQVTLTQFGRILDRTYQEPGLYFRIPFIQKTHYLESRFETWEGYVDYIPTADRQYMAVESVAHWRIAEPVKFMEALGSRELAESRLDTILDGAVKNMISTHKLVDTVRNSNRILNSKIQLLEIDVKGTAKLQALEKQFTDEIASTLESVTVGREHLTRKMLSEAAAELELLGIELLNVFIKHISYAPSVELTVYARMSSERIRVAERLMSLGRAERERILGQLSRDAQDILAPAQRDAEIIRGRADAKALGIYSQAFGKNPQFYNFWRTLQAYRFSLPENTTVIASTQSKFYDVFFNRGPSTQNGGLPGLPGSSNVQGQSAQSIRRTRLPDPAKEATHISSVNSKMQ